VPGRGGLALPSVYGRGALRRAVAGSVATRLIT